MCNLQMLHMPKIVMAHSVMAGTWLNGTSEKCGDTESGYTDIDGFRYKIFFFSPIKLSVYSGDVMVLISGQDDRLLDIVNSFKISSAK